MDVNTLNNILIIITLLLMIFVYFYVIRDKDNKQ